MIMPLFVILYYIHFSAQRNNAADSDNYGQYPDIRRIVENERFPVHAESGEVPVRQGHPPDRSSIYKSTVLFVLLHLCKCNVLCKVVVE